MVEVGARNKDKTLAMGDVTFFLKESSIHDDGTEQKQLFLDFFSKAAKDVGGRHLFLENYVA